jgi:hypothetical protein
MRQRGWRQLRVWVPDTRTEATRASLAEQSRAIAANVEDEDAVMDWIDSGVDWSDWR